MRIWELNKKYKRVLLAFETFFLENFLFNERIRYLADDSCPQVVLSESPLALYKLRGKRVRHVIAPQGKRVQRDFVLSSTKGDSLLLRAQIFSVTNCTLARI